MKNISLELYEHAIERVKIEIGGEVLDLSREEALELQKLLNDIFMKGLQRPYDVHR